MAGTVKVTGMKIDGVEFQVEAEDGMSLKEIASKVGVEYDGAAFIVNGVSLSKSAADKARVTEGNVEVHRPNKGGC